MYAIQLGTPSWNWMARHYPRTPLSRNSKEAMPIVWPRLLEHLLLLPKDIDALKKVRQPKLFLSLKKDLALVSL